MTGVPPNVLTQVLMTIFSAMTMFLRSGDSYKSVLVDLNRLMVSDPCLFYSGCYSRGPPVTTRNDGVLETLRGARWRSCIRSTPSRTVLLLVENSEPAGFKVGESGE